MSAIAEVVAATVNQASDRAGNSTIFPYGLPLPLTIDSPRTKYWLQRVFQTDLKEAELGIRTSDRLCRRIAKEAKRNGVGDPVKRLFLLLVNPISRAHVYIDPGRDPVLSFEAGILRLYRPGEHAGRFDHRDLRGQIEWWPQVEENVSRLDEEQAACLRTLPSVFEDLAGWDTHSPEHRELLTLAVFAFGSLLEEPMVLDAAVKTQPKIADRFAPLGWWRPDGRELPYTPIPDLIKTVPRDGVDNPLTRLVKEIKYLYRDLMEEEPTAGLVIGRVRALHHIVTRDEEKFRSLMAESVMNEIEQLREVNTVIDKALQQTGIELPVDVPAYCQTIGQRALPVVELDHADRCIAVIRELKCRMLGVTADNKKTFESIITGNAELKSIAQAPSANIGRIAELSAEILGLQDRLRTEMETLRPLLVVPPASLRPVPIPAPTKEPAPVVPPAPVTDPDTENLALLADIEQLQRELSERNTEIYRLKHRPAVTGPDAPEPGPTALQVADLMVKTGRVPPAAVLKLMQTLYGTDRLVVLDSAFESAKKSDSFRQPERLYSLLTCLITDYAEALRRGTPDASARQLLGNAYRAQESEPVQTSRRLARLRTFRYEGRDVMMTQHLGIGATSDAPSTIRVHFLWDGALGRIVIGYAGPHLPTHER